MNKILPYNKPFIVGKELSYIAQAVLEENRLAGDGEFTHKCQEWLENELSTPKALLTNSCTSALEMAALLADIQQGDEIIMPSFTFVSTANAFVLRGGIPVFIDINPNTLNINENIIEEAITPKTKIIVPVHYAGFPCEMETIMRIAKKHNLLVVEDAAQGLLSIYQDKYLGTIGHLGALSFHETKNIISGEGGALLINDNHFIERAEIIWEKGTNRKSFFRGEVDKYTWVDIGSSFLPSELMAAFLYAQLENAKRIIEKRVRLFNKYTSGLKFLESEGEITLQKNRGNNDGNAHIFYLITKTKFVRDKLIAFLKKKQIMAIFHYVPLHSSPAGRKYGRTHGDLHISKEISETIVRLPMYFELKEQEIEYVIDCINQFYGK